MGMVPKRLLVTAALGAALASTSIVETKAMQIPVTTETPSRAPPDRTGPVARVRLARRWRGGWRGYGWRGYGWRGCGWRR